MEWASVLLSVSCGVMCFVVGQSSPYSLIFVDYVQSDNFKPAAAAKSLQSCPTLCDPHRQQPTRLPRPWDSPGKNTGGGCHFLLQGRKMKSESEVAKSCPTLSKPMDCSPPGSSVHGIFQARVLEWGAIAFKNLKIDRIRVKTQIGD